MLLLLLLAVSVVMSTHGCFAHTNTECWCSYKCYKCHLLLVLTTVPENISLREVSHKRISVQEDIANIQKRKEKRLYNATVERTHITACALLYV